MPEERNRRGSLEPTGPEDDVTPEGARLPRTPPPRKRRPQSLPREVRWPPLEIEAILAWADAHRTRTGEWPTSKSGVVPEFPAISWEIVDVALRAGSRGLPGGSSLARLLSERRGARNRKALPRLTVEKILAWADAHHERHGRWPTGHSGPVEDAPGESWQAIDIALNHGIRGLPGGSSLAQLLTEGRGKRNKARLPPLSIEQILGWADAFHARHDRWPGVEDGPIPEAPGETWTALNHALNRGRRGMRAGTSLARLLMKWRGAPNPLAAPRLTVARVLELAEIHYRRTGRWPTGASGPIQGLPGDTWLRINAALMQGGRGLPGGYSLHRLLEAHRAGLPPPDAAPPPKRSWKPKRDRSRRRDLYPELTVVRILEWVDAHFAATGDWPNQYTGQVRASPREQWARIDQALRLGHRGLPGGSSLPLLLARCRGVRTKPALPRLTALQILGWADAHRERIGRWPSKGSGPIRESPGDTWNAIDLCLKKGMRGLPGGQTLSRLLARRRPVKNAYTRTDFTEALMLDWADAHCKRTGSWPTSASGAIRESPGDTWRDIDRGLRRGLRGLPSGSSLAQLLASRRGARNVADLPRLTVEEILGWCDAYYSEHRHWPRKNSEPVPASPEDTWANIDDALRHGRRGLPEGSALSRLLEQHRGIRPRQGKSRPALSVEQVLGWADRYYVEHGRWPDNRSGPVADAPGETWGGIYIALYYGYRSLPATGMSLLHMLRHRRPRAIAEG